MTDAPVAVTLGPAFLHFGRGRLYVAGERGAAVDAFHARLVEEILRGRGELRTLCASLARTSGLAPATIARGLLVRIADGDSLLELGRLPFEAVDVVVSDLGGVLPTDVARALVGALRRRARVAAVERCGADWRIDVGGAGVRVREDAFAFVQRVRAAATAAGTATTLVLAGPLDAILLGDVLGGGSSVSIVGADWPPRVPPDAVLGRGGNDLTALFYALRSLEHAASEVRPTGSLALARLEHAALAGASTLLFRRVTQAAHLAALNPGALVLPYCPWSAPRRSPAGANVVVLGGCGHVRNATLAGRVLKLTRRRKIVLADGTTAVSARPVHDGVELRSHSEDPLRDAALAVVAGDTLDDLGVLFRALRNGVPVLLASPPAAGPLAELLPPLHRLDLTAPGVARRRLESAQRGPLRDELLRSGRAVLRRCSAAAAIAAAAAPQAVG